MSQKIWWIVPALLFLGSVVLTTAPFVGDGPDYTAQIADIVAHRQPTANLWEPGHILWRPLGYAAAPLFENAIPESLAWSPALKIYCGLALFSVLCGVLGSILLFDISLRLSGSVAASAVLSLLFVWGDAVLAYSKSATPYIAGLTALVAGIWWQIGSDRRGRRAWIAGPVLFGIAGLFWLPYLVAIPAACCTELLLRDGNGRRGWKRAVLGMSVSGMLVIAGIGVAGTLAGEHSAVEWQHWLTAAGHGMHQNRQAIRAVSGASRLFLDLDKDGVYFKRFLFHDPYHPVSMAGLFRHSLWKVALFYLMLASTLALAWKSRHGRKALGLLALAAAPALFAAVVIFEPSSPERFLPVLPFLVVCIASAWSGGEAGRLGRLSRIGICAFALLLPILNFPAFVWGTADFHHTVESQLTKLRAHAKPQDAVFTVTIAEPLQEIGLHPFDPENQNPVRAMFVVDPMNGDLRHWRNRFAQEVESEWAHGRAVWIEKYVLRDRPADILLWTEGDNPDIRWRDVPEFFRTLEFDQETAGTDGFLRISPLPKNGALLQDLLRN